MEKEKAVLIDAIYQRIAANRHAKEHFKREFHVDDKTFEKMVKKFLDMWLDSPEMVMFLCEMLGVYPVEEGAEQGEEGADYLG